MFTDTTRIENDVRTALQRDRLITRPELIAVTVDGIGTVVLRGAVPTVRQRRAAAHDARRIDGVFEVIDHLKIHPPVEAVRHDDEIRAEALQRLSADSRIHAEHLHVSVSHGQLTLTGRVRHESQRDAAEDDVADVPGILGLSNQIDVR
jgi:osmotically-inducible protein OsmY